MADNASFSAPDFPDWQPQYRAALLETDPKHLHQRILTAEEAIYVRLQVLVNSPNGNAERLAIEDAMRALRVMQVEKLGFPEWNKI